MKKKILYVLFLAPLVASSEFGSGFYTGIGAGWSQFKASQSIRGETPGMVYFGPEELRNRKFKKNVFSPSVFGGYRYRKPDQPWTIALELSFLPGKAKAKMQTPRADYEATHIERKLGGMLQLKPGYVFGEKYMLYGILGTRLDRCKWQYTLHARNPVFHEHINDKKLIPGFVAGIGIERALKKIHMGLQTNYTFYARKTFKGVYTEPILVKMRAKLKAFQVALYLAYAF